MLLLRVDFQWTVSLWMSSASCCRKQCHKASGWKYGRKKLSTFLFSRLLVGNSIFHWVSYEKSCCDSFLSAPSCFGTSSKSYSAKYAFCFRLYYFPFPYRLLLRAYPQGKFSCVWTPLTAPRWNVCVLTGGGVMQKASKAILHSLELHPAHPEPWLGNFHACSIC